MSAKSEFLKKNGLAEEEAFELILGCENGVLPGKVWNSYFVVPGESSMVCHKANDESTRVEIQYASFEKAEFGVGSGNLWLQCSIDGEFMAFCSTKKNWRSAPMRTVLEKLGALISEEDKKLYAAATGKLGWLYLLFKG